MNRFVALLNNEGFQAWLQLASNPEETSARIKEINNKNYDNRIKIIYLFEEEKDPRQTREWELRELRDYIERYKKKLINKIAKDDNSADPSSYTGYELRKRFVSGSNQVEAFYAVKKSDNDLLIHRNPYEAAFHILDICITGKTRLNRFNDKKEVIIIGVNLTKDFDKKRRDFKTLRRLMMSHLQDEDEDKDEIWWKNGIYKHDYISSKNEIGIIYIEILDYGNLEEYVKILKIIKDDGNEFERGKNYFLFKNRNKYTNKEIVEFIFEEI